MAVHVKIDIFEGEALTDINLSGTCDMELLQLLSALAVVQVRITEQIAKAKGVKIKHD